MMIFGVLLVALFCVAGFFAVVVFLSTEKGRRSPMVPVMFAGMMVLLLFVGTRCARDSDVEWNPPIRDDATVVGTWRDAAETLGLDADHTFHDRTASQTVGGTWKREDWNLALSGDHFSGAMEFVRVRGQYRLIHAPFDPDDWDENLGLRRTPR